MKTVVVGIDPSSKKVAIIVTVDGGPPMAYIYKTEVPDLNERCAYFYRRTYSFCVRLLKAHPNAEIHVFVEDPVLGRGGARSTIVQSKVNGAIGAAVLNSGAAVRVIQVNNQQWKKKVVGKGNAGKPEITAWAKQYYRQLWVVANNGKDQDLIDAGCINRHGVAVTGLLERIRKQRILDARKPIKRKPLRRRARG